MLLYGENPIESAVVVLINIAIFFVFLLIIRGFILWYFRINETVKHLKLTNALLLEIAKVIVPNLPKVEDVHEIAAGQPATQEERDHVTKNWIQKDWDRFYETGVMRPHEPEPGENQDK